jgi:serine/threonine-protein kinase
VGAFAVATLIAAFLFLHNDSSPGATVAVPPPPTASETTTESGTTTTRASTTETTTSTPTSTAAPRGASLPGTDAQGFVGSYARCDAGNTPAVVAQTTKSQVVVCQAGPGNFIYRGVRLSDGATIQLTNAVRSSGGFDVTNPADGTRYQVRPDAVAIIQPDGRVDSEPVVQYGSS